MNFNNGTVFPLEPQLMNLSVIFWLYPIMYLIHFSHCDIHIWSHRKVIKFYHRLTLFPFIIIFLWAGNSKQKMIYPFRHWIQVFFFRTFYHLHLTSVGKILFGHSDNVYLFINIFFHPLNDSIRKHSVIEYSEHSSVNLLHIIIL